jgi:hypothetical protein
MLIDCNNPSSAFLCNNFHQNPMYNYCHSSLLLRCMNLHHSNTNSLCPSTVPIRSLLCFCRQIPVLLTSNLFQGFLLCCNTSYSTDNFFLLYCFHMLSGLFPEISSSLFHHKCMLFRRFATCSFFPEQWC